MLLLDAGNALTGSIPVSFSQLYQVTYLRLEHNKLTGTLPASLFMMSNLSSIILVSPTAVSPGWGVVHPVRMHTVSAGFASE